MVNDDNNIILSFNLQEEFKIKILIYHNFKITKKFIKNLK